MDLAAALAAGGNREGARREAARAQGIYLAKGNLVSARRARETAGEAVRQRA